MKKNMLSRWNAALAVVVMLALAPAAALASKKHDSRGKSDRSSHSILLKQKQVKKYSIWESAFDFRPSKNKNKGKDNYWGGKGKNKWYGYLPHFPKVKPKDDKPPYETPIPEPGAALLFSAGAGLVALHLRARRRHAS